MFEFEFIEGKRINTGLTVWAQRAVKGFNFRKTLRVPLAARLSVEANTIRETPPEVLEKRMRVWRERSGYNELIH